jgi:hypothetical protein
VLISKRWSTPKHFGIDSFAPPMGNLKPNIQVWSMTEFQTEAFGTVDLIPLTAGILFLLAGWLLYWLSLNAAGCIIGGGIGLLGAEALLTVLDLREPWGLVIQAGATVLGAIIGALIARFLHRTAFFIIGAAAGCLAWYFSVNALRRDDLAAWAENDAIFAFGVPAGGVICGIIAVISDRYLIALASSVLGAVLVMIGVQWQWGVWPVIPLALAGFLIQIGLTSRKKKRQDEDE